MDILEDLDYDIHAIRDTLNERIENSTLVDEKQKKHILGELYLFLNDNGYLKTIG
jgi:arginine decarboxylase